MKSFQNFCNKYTLILVSIFCLFSIFLHAQNYGFPPFNSDEASFAYNGYAIAETGRDEYGAFMPSRFKAFGENKLPVTIYTIAAFVKVLGLNEFSSRLPFILIGISAPILFFFLANKLFKNAAIAIVAAFLASLSPWIQIMSRHIHENVIIMLLTIMAMIYFVKLLNKFTYINVVIISLLSGVALFTYHIGKVLSLYFFAILMVVLFMQKKSFSIFLKTALIFLIPVIFFLFTEFQNPTTRVSNLLFINDAGFTASIEEQRREHDSRIIHNKGSQSLITLTQQYLTYFSPEFLVINGDSNARFGLKGISPITPVTYVLFFIGLYYVFKNNEKYRLLIISLLLVAPITASLSWQEYSLTRSFLMIIPIVLLASYGTFHLLSEVKWKFLLPLLSLAILGSYMFFTFYSWDFYFHHYPQKKEAVYAWQGGYKELNGYIKERYDETQRFYITNKLGQPYIFTLFYLPYPPAEYHKQAQLTELDEYGFGQVEGFDKFTFSFKTPTDEKNVVYIGYPEDFQGTGIKESQVEKVTFNNEEVFWIYNMR